MALAPLATAADLALRQISGPGPLVDQMLNAASTTVRDAAGAAISRATSTINIPGVQGQYLTLPGQPIISVSVVEIDGEAVTDYKLTAGALWRSSGWMTCEPTEVTVTMVHGFAEVPADIVDLVCSLAIAGLDAAQEGRDPNVVEEEIDDHRTRFAAADDAVASVFELPERTKLWLAARFGAGAYVTSER